MKSDIFAWRAAYEEGYRAYYGGDTGGYTNAHQFGSEPFRAFNRGHQYAESEVQRIHGGQVRDVKALLPLPAPPLTWK